MKKVTVMKGTKVSKVEFTPFCLDDFMPTEEKKTTLVTVSKKELKTLAKELGLDFDDKSIALSKKLLNAYLKRSV